MNTIIEDSKMRMAGEAYMSVFQYISSVFFFGFLSTMFVLRYVKVYKSIEADKRKDIINLKNMITYDPIYGGITMTFFPINIILLPFILPLIILKSERLNEFVLKAQYFILVVLYIGIGALISVPLAPFLYVKIIINSGYIAANNKRYSYPCESSIKFIFSLVFAPFLIVLSLLIDFLSLNVSLLKDEKYFEFKYQKMDPFSDQDPVQITNNLVNMFLSRQQKKLSMTKDQLRIMKTKQFNIVDNYHSFFCRGDKSYKDSMANIKIFNLTKALGN